MVRILFALLVGLGSLLSSAQVQTLLVFVDSLSAGYQKVMMNDGIHPTPAAQPQIRDKIARFMGPLMRC